LHPGVPEINRDGQDLFRAYSWLKNYNQLPEPGGWANQTGKFIRAVEFCDLVVVKMNECRQERNKQLELKAKLLGK